MNSNKNGQRGIHEAPTPEQVAAVNAMRQAQIAAAFAQRREALAGIILNGICSGLYSNPSELVEGFGDRAVNDAVVFADRLMAQLAKAPEPAKAANDAPAPPNGETATGGTDSPQ